MPDQAIADGPRTQTSLLSETRVGAYEKALLRRYALSAFTSDRGNSITLSEEALRWYDDNRKKVGLSLPGINHKLSRIHRKDDWPGLVRINITAADRATARFSVKLPLLSALQKRLDWIASTLRLTAVQSSYLGAVVRLTEIPSFQALGAAFSGRESDCDEVAADTVCKFLGQGRVGANRHRSHVRALHRLGLIEHRGRNDWAPSATVLAILSLRTFRETALRHALFGMPRRSSLTVADFEHMKEKVGNTSSILSGALTNKEKGAALLFYGAPGTGKTEFAALIGELVGAQTVFIGEMPHSDSRLELERRHEPSREDRLSHLAFSSQLASLTGRIILVVDEADDIFTGVDDDDWSSRTGSKVFMNRLVEESPAPVIFITNNPDRLGEAVLRRMLYAVEFSPISEATRRRVIQRHAMALGVSLDDMATVELSQLPASPALIEAGIRAAALAASNQEQEHSNIPRRRSDTKAAGEIAAPTAVKRPIEGQVAVTVVASLLKASGRSWDRRPSVSSPKFDPMLSNADIDLLALEDRIRQARGWSLSFLLDGLPGTGKSAFARHLASVMELEILQKRGSDIFASFVGETEANIAQAFEEAADTGRFLIFDEADSLLASRLGAERNWEVSQVNEMLTWMESHPLPFAATTNHASRIDPAAVRRFLFKVRFDAMTAVQAEKAFLRFFKRNSIGDQARQRLRKLFPLTPSDFALVSRKSLLLGIEDEAQILGMLSAEVAAKPGATIRIGF
ncbi:AAA family ATPase [Rhizobium ruizarguesonis]|uniref:AAA family ATPase n=1 Tax=Rhizobium ruizarguesonis TaxID=2081791 RepID=UPI00103574A9|nr:AAA family ATPase [Rhizobium ruizarguesonis]NEI81396.1 AAA family ATPase [Rhizobium ruizarguesonis]NEK06922.1 AAA family ATPase [Rhizobium ruizarguesonis]TBD39629.1 AAA family ATPase [Rhizobium ruizarguesonis]